MLSFHENNQLFILIHIVEWYIIPLKCVLELKYMEIIGSMQNTEISTYET